MLRIPPRLKGAEGFGFKPRLLDYPSFVSPYDEPDYGYSASLIPSHYIVLSPRLRRTPRIDEASFKDSSLTFSTIYYQSRSDKWELIPVSVNTQKYFKFRSKKSDQEIFDRSIDRLLFDPQRQNSRKGLGVNIGLPKRLDKLFGEGGADLRVSGFRKIIFSGRSSWNDAATTDVYTQSKFPSLSMEQISRIDIQGTIGSKITVKVSQDSQTDIPLANRIQLRYKGDDDDILKVIEAGNTNLSLPNTKFVGYSQRIQGLFGLKAEAQIGSMRFIGIASQEKGTSESSSITATGEEMATFKRDNQYALCRIFDLGDDNIFQEGDKVINLSVFEQETKEENLEADSCDMYVNPLSPDPNSLETVKGIKVVQLEASTYEFHDGDSLRPYPYVYFTSSRGLNKALGVWMEIKRGNDTIVVGDVANPNKKTLKMLRPTPANLSPSNETWKLMWRNCYDVPKGVEDVDDLNLKIFKGLPDTEGSSSHPDYQDDGNTSYKYIQIMGLDQVNSSNANIPDGKVDDLDYYRKEWGLLIFPSRYPFATDETFGNAPRLDDSLDNIYNYTSSEDQITPSKYYIQIMSKNRSSKIRLGRANIIDGSERVYLNGRLLERNKDYSVNYDFGQLTLTTEEASDPNADIKIDFEYAPFFALQKKTLFGMRAEYERNDNFKIGSTVLYKTDKAQERKPRVGEETAKMMVYDVDMSATLHPNFLTSMIDALPLVTTEARSNLKVSAEFAQSRPNPNVEGVAYIDDFESALDQLSLGMNRTSWHIASTPVTIDTLKYQRGKILWHTPATLPLVEEVYNKDAQAGQGTVRTFRMFYRPQNFKLDSTIVHDGEDSTVASIDTIPNISSWAGIMRFFNSRVDATRAQLFEVRMKTSEKMHGKLHFDFGRVSEELDMWESVRSKTYTEDNITPNGAVDEEEDRGLDGLKDEEEPFYDKDTLPDPHGDNFYYDGFGDCPLPNGGNCDVDSLKYEWLNGTEGNMNDIGFLGRPDQEVLSSGGLSIINNYFSYAIDFDSMDSRCYAESLLVPGSENVNGWGTYRIPIRDSLYLDTMIFANDTLEPNWDQITHIRVWFESDEETSMYDTIEVANWYFVQSNWQDSLVEGLGKEHNAEFVVASVSEEDNTFTPPPGVEAYTDPQTNVTEPQRGLLLQFEDLPPHDTCVTTKSLYLTEQYSGYRTMKMYVHGDDNIDTRQTKFFFRLGKDEDNFYEYKSKIYPGWDSRNFVDLDFNEITALKDAALRNLQEGENRFDMDTTDDNYDGYSLRVKGQPNINEVLYFAAGVINDTTGLDIASNISGSIWLDELRVTDVRRDIGTAGRVSLDGSFADLLTYNFSLESKDPYFRKISTATRGGSSNNLGSGKTETIMSYSLSLKVDKFLPRSWSASLPVSYRYSKSTSTPLLRTNSDIVLPENIREEEKTVRESIQLSASESFQKKGKNPLFSILLNRLKTRYSYSRNNSTSPTQPYQFSENHSINSDYNLSVKSPPTLPILFFTKYVPILKKVSSSKLGLYPSSWKVHSDYSRNLSIYDDVNDNRTSSIKRDLNASMDVSYSLFQNLSMNFGVSTKRDLSNLDDVNLDIKRLKLGIEKNFAQSYKVSYDPKLFNFLTFPVNYSSTYRDNYDVASDTRRSDMTRSWGVSGKFDHISLLGGKGGRGSKRPSRGNARRDVRGGGKKETKDDGTPLYQYPLIGLRLMTSWINPFSYGYNRSFDRSVPGMLDRPGWRYRFGLDLEPNVDTTTSSGRSHTASEGESYNVGTGFDVLGGITTNLKYEESNDRDIIKQGTRYENTSINWPNLDIRIKQFKKLPLVQGPVNKFIECFLTQDQL